MFTAALLFLLQVPVEPATAPPPPATEPTGAATEPRLTDEEVAAAIANPKPPRCEGRQAKAGGRQTKNQLFGLKGSPGMLACTPAARIAMAASKAKSEFRPFGPADVDEIDRSYFTVVALPPTTMSAKMTKINRVVLRDAAKATVVPPAKEVPLSERMQNAFGAEKGVQAMHASFPMADVARLAKMNPKGEFVVTIATDERTVDYEVKAKDLGLQ